MYKLHLILKYLRNRYIAWWSLLAVILCTTMVIVVISVMGGWLVMFRQSFHGLTGDVIVRSESLTGFPYYEEMIDKIQQQPGVAAAVPEIETYGLLNIGNIPTAAVQVLGVPMDRIGEVNRFPDSLYRQHTEIQDELAKKDLPATERAKLEAKLKEKPSFDLIDKSVVPLANLPGDVTIANPATNQIAVGETKPTLWYDAQAGRLIYRGVMTPEQRDALQQLSKDAKFKAAIGALYDHSNDGSVIDYADLLPRAKSDVTKWPGLIAGIGVVYVSRNREGNWESPLGSREVTPNNPGIYGVPVKLTVLGINPGEAIDLTNKTERSYWIVDTSRTQIWQYDNKEVYVPFAQLQSDLGMGGKSARDLTTGEEVRLPARTSEIHIRMKDGAKLDDVARHVQAVVNQVESVHGNDDFLSSTHPYVETWEHSQRTWLDAIENEKLMMVILFAIMSIVAIFLIFCIFYMIVMEKTRDIGIIKSVGATSTGVAMIFLGYGLVIGVIGAGIGLLISYVLIHWINEIHGMLGKLFGIQIWNPEVYLFDKIPNTMNPREVTIICGIAVLSSVLGALVPAIRAATLHPVDALRWE